MDRIIRGFDKELKYRYTFINSTNIVEEARKTHNTSTTSTAALGRLLTQALLMGVDLKNDNDSITITIKGDGPIGTMIAVVDGDSNVKGYVQNPEVDIESTDAHTLQVGKIIGSNGTISIIRDYGLKEPYTAQIPIVSGEIAEDFANYYATSEQIPTVLILGVLIDKDFTVKTAGGLLIQALPGVQDDDFIDLENAINNLPPFSELLDKLSMEEILVTYFSELEFEVADTRNPKYKCNCSLEKVTRALISIGEIELNKILNEDGQAEIVCEFCKKKYLFDKEELTKLINTIKEKS